MIHEFAVEPELIFEWSAQRRDCAYFADSMGLGQPRILARYPADWKKRALRHAAVSWQPLEAAVKSSEDAGRLDFRKKRFEALMLSLVTDNKTIGRGDLQFDKEKEWIANATPHAPDPFRAILARMAEPRSKYVLTGDDVAESQHWRLERSCVVPRTAGALGDAVAAVLTRCVQVTLVDPHFHPKKPAYMAVLREFLRILSASRGTAPTITVWTTALIGRELQPWGDFAAQCKEARIDSDLAVGCSVRIVRYREKAGGEKIHNRYILTDIGGIIFGTGLDSGPAETTDDITIMERAQYERRWRQYSIPTTAFDMDPTESITIVGTGRTSTGPVAKATKRSR